MEAFVMTESRYHGVPDPRTKLAWVGGVFTGSVAATRIGPLQAPLKLWIACEPAWTPADAVPFVWSGFRGPVIVIPATLLADAPNLRLILMHELAHISRRDHLVRPLDWALWLNPLARVARSDWGDRGAREHCARHAHVRGFAP